MFIRHIFVTRPMVAIAVLVCMATILTLFKLNRRKPLRRSDKFLIGFVGLLAIFEGIKVLKDAGVVQLAVNDALNDALELLVAMACLSAAVLLQISRVNHLDVESAVRLARAAPPRRAQQDSPMLHDASTLDTLTWAIPRLSDGAFKLFAMLCLRADASSGRVTVGMIELQLKLNRGNDEIDRLLNELRESGAVKLNRIGSTLDFEIVTPSRRLALAEIPVHPALATESRT